MLQNMFVGKPPGNYDRLLDFSRAVTGGLFFAPSATFLDNIGADGSASPAIAASPEPKPSETPEPPLSSSVRESSLKIGSLKGKKDE